MYEQLSHGVDALDTVGIWKLVRRGFLVEVRTGERRLQDLCPRELCEQEDKSQVGWL